MEIQSLIGSEKRIRERKEEFHLPQNSEDAEIELLRREETNAMSLADLRDSREKKKRSEDKNNKNIKHRQTKNQKLPKYPFTNFQHTPDPFFFICRNTPAVISLFAKIASAFFLYFSKYPYTYFFISQDTPMPLFCLFLEIPLHYLFISQNPPNFYIS